MKTLDERIIEMRLTRETANGLFWLFLVMFAGSLALKGLGVEVWSGASWVALTVICVSHQVARHAKRWLKYMKVPSEFAEPFDFDLPECEDSVRWKSQTDRWDKQAQSNGATEEVNYRAHA